ncbi:MAG: GDP-mannose 4,6-dehydratase [Prochlorococcus sp. SP3034]|nr:GDP-mannose 4,6-dehydratase [Prochlorococcus sp. SP3034]|tara:strand:+ start:5 stop:973 length:969 start_codon:yes stop_codon:yes gene_type:complete
MKKIALIFGISGQDGAYLAQLLIKKGYKVHGTSRDAEIARFSSLKELKIKEEIVLHSVALNDFRSTLKVIEKVSPHEIYNLAGQSSVGLSFEQPLETLESIATATINILEAIRFIGAKCKFYNAGSSECFGDTGENPANENTPFRPKSPYGVAKASAFWQVDNYRESYGLFACSGIMFNHESILRPSRFVTKKICQSAANIALGKQKVLNLGNLSIKRDWGWAPEYVEAMWLMLQKEDAADYVIATGKRYGLKDFVKYAFSTFDLNWEKYVIINDSLKRPSEIQSGFGSPKKANSNLKWNAKTFMPEIANKIAKEEFNRLNR